ncbi:MAG: tellurite resistance TerB family protein [Deltaproteobacteria bacterium]|nr:tellurite resistance TerB family protein [Deltaproteobacteria bacterium]
MFNPEKLLGGLLSGGSKRGASSMLTSQIGMGLLGVAMEAVDHYMKKPAGQSPPAMGASGGSVPPPPPGAQPVAPSFSGPAATTAPPPPPGAAWSPAPQPPPPSQAETSCASGRQKDAIVLIRAMIAAANADGAIDQQERQRILDKFRSVDLSPDEHAFLLQELLAPAELESIVKQVDSAGMARQVYAVSLMAITVDSEAERVYLRALGQSLGLSADDCNTVHKALGIDSL